jgi:tRNA pseudouridine55 synthase
MVFIKKNKNNLNGVLLINKPVNLTSADIVSILKKKLNPIKIGHTGTLDPKAQGLLIIVLGEATKLVNYFMDLPKEYIFEIQLGEQKDTDDIEGVTIAKTNHYPSYNEFIDIIPNYLGCISQTPSKYSAIKINGDRAYTLSRNNIDFIVPSRNITIHSLKLLNYNTNTKKITFIASVSKGTYIRTLALDICKSLNTLGYLSYLNRISIGKFQNNNFISFNKINNDILLKSIIKIEDILDDIPGIIVDKEDAEKIMKGNLTLPIDLGFKKDLFKVIYNNKLVSLIDGKQHPYKILRNFNH